MPCAVLPVFLINYHCARLKDDWHMHHHGSRYPHSWASDKNRVEEYWQEREPQQAQFRERLYEREGQVRQMRTIIAIVRMRATTLTNVLLHQRCFSSLGQRCCTGLILGIGLVSSMSSATILTRVLV